MQVTGLSPARGGRFRWRDQTGAWCAGDHAAGWSARVV